MRSRTVANVLTSAFWLLFVVRALVDGVHIAVTATGPAAITARLLLLGVSASAVALLVMMYLFRGLLFSGKPSLEMTRKESVQLTVFYLLAIACLGISIIIWGLSF